MKYNTHKPYRMQPAVHPGWRPAIPTRMEMTKMIQPTAPAPAGNWCHLFTPLTPMAFSRTTDTVFGHGTRIVSQPEANSVVPVDAGAFWLGRGGEKRCPCHLKAGRALKGCISHTSFLGDGRSSCGGGVCYAQVNPQRGPAIPSSSSFHPANPEGVSSRCTL